MRNFQARLSPFLKGYTLVLTAAVVAAAAYLASQGQVVTAVLVLGGLLFLSLFSVRGYAVGNGRLLIKRAAWVTTVELSGLREASPAPGLVSRSVSLWSTRGLFGVIGYAYRKGLGVYRAYVTDPRTAVVLQFQSGKKVVVSPDSPGDFLSAIAAEPARPAAA
jgi:hypothetical protein